MPDSSPLMVMSTWGLPGTRSTLGSDDFTSKKPSWPSPVNESLKVSVWKGSPSLMSIDRRSTLSLVVVLPSKLMRRTVYCSPSSTFRVTSTFLKPPSSRTSSFFSALNMM